MLTKKLLPAIVLLGLILVAFKQDNYQQKKQFIYVLRYTDEFKKEMKFRTREQGIVREHVAYLRELRNGGNCYLAGRTINFFDSTLFGIIVFDAPNLDAAKEIMNNDPIIKNDLMVGQLQPFTVVVFRE